MICRIVFSLIVGCLVFGLSGEFSVTRGDDVTFPVVGTFPDVGLIPESNVRTLHVRPSNSEELGDDPVVMKYYPFDEPAPPSPAQGDILLTPNDELTIVAPSLAYSGIIGKKDLLVCMNESTITVYSIVNILGMTGTMYGPSERLIPIGKLPEGEYQLCIRRLLLSSEDEFDPNDFVQNPDEYSANTYETNHTFSVVPEPVTLTLLLSAVPLGLLRHRRRNEYRAGGLGKIDP